MLSKSCVQCISQTLEEPPKACHFILATTGDRNFLKLLSHDGQVSQFQKPTAEMLKGHVTKIAETRRCRN